MIQDCDYQDRILEIIKYFSEEMFAGPFAKIEIEELETGKILYRNEIRDFGGANANFEYSIKIILPVFFGYSRYDLEEKMLLSTHSTMSGVKMFSSDLNICRIELHRMQEKILESLFKISIRLRRTDEDFISITLRKMR